MERQSGSVREIEERDLQCRRTKETITVKNRREKYHRRRRMKKREKAAETPERILRGTRKDANADRKSVV